jgi:thymidylate kinase
MARAAGRAVHPTRVPPQWSRQAPLVRQFLTTRSGDHAAAAHGEAVLCDRYVFHALALADAMGQRTEELALIARRFPMPDAVVFLAPSPCQAALYRGIAAALASRTWPGHVVLCRKPAPLAA